MRPEQVTAVRGDLVVTQRNMAVFSEMLSELRPGLEHPEVSRVLPDESTGMRSVLAGNELVWPG